MKKLRMESVDLISKNVEKIAELFPECVAEAADKDGNLRSLVDFDKLRQVLSGDVAEEPERYDFTWVGKRAALAEAHTPIRKTLRPCPEESRDWDTTQNLYIEGDNLDVLKLLQESYLGKVKMIYIDPPYNTGSDSFVYPDNYRADDEEYEAQGIFWDEDGNKVFKENIDTNPRFHSDWCSMIYSRLTLARNLLTEDGVIFISIDDTELYNLRKICDEVFGEKNFQGTFVIVSSPSAIDYGCMAKMHEYSLMYSKSHANVSTNLLIEEGKKFDYQDEQGGFIIYPLYNGNVAFNPQTRPNLFYPFYLNPKGKMDNNFYEIGLEPKEGWIEVWPVISKKDGIQRVWRWGKEEKARKNLNKEIVGYRNREGEFRIVQKYRSDMKAIRSILSDKSMSSRRGTAEVQNLFEKKVFSFPKPTELIKQFIMTGTNDGDVIMDFFSGSSTCADAVMQLNSIVRGHRKFIMAQLPEPCNEESVAAKEGYSNICEIGKERIRRAGDKIKKENPLTSQNLDIGFRVLKVDSTNMNDVYYGASGVSQDLIKSAESNVKDDRTDLDLLFGCLLDWGLPLSLPYKSEEIDGVAIHDYNSGDLIACFAENVLQKAFEKVVETIAKRKPIRAVFRDSCFETDAAKINVTEIFKRYSPDTRIKTI